MDNLAADFNVGKKAYPKTINMSKRRLSNQQRARVNKRARAGDGKEDPSWKAGVVVAHHGKRVDVRPGALFQDDADQSDIVSGHIRANLPTLVCGDEVLYRLLDEHKDSAPRCVIEKIKPRRSVLNRPRPYSDPKPMVANVDLIVLVIAPYPDPIASLIDRYLIAAEQTGIDIIIVINKTDLLASDSNPAICEELNALAALYQSLNYQVFSLSAMNDNHGENQIANTQSANDLFQLLTNKTSVLVGQSGVGKSSIINSAADREIALTGEISDSTIKGKHTTTHSALFELNLNWQDDTGSPRKGACAVIDSPGIREFGLWHLSDDDIINGLREFRHFANECKFRDCDHQFSEGCALQRAFENGDIHPSRIASYRHILASRDEH